MSKTKQILSILVTILVFQIVSYACEPAVPLTKMLFGSIAISNSVLVLSATVLLKCIAFIYFERSIIWWKAFVFLFTANLFSTVVGVIASIPASIPSCLPALIIIFFLALFPSRRLARFYFPNRNVKSTASVIAFAMTVVFFIAMVLAIAIQGLNYPSGKALDPIMETNFSTLAGYFLFKLSFIYTSLIFGIFLTIFYEEWLVSILATKNQDSPVFLTSVSRANYVALFFMMTVSAIMTLPERIQNHDFGFLIK